MKYSFSGSSSSIHSSLGFEDEEQVVVVDLSSMHCTSTPPMVSHISFLRFGIISYNYIILITDQFRFLIISSLFLFNFRNISTFISFTFQVFKIFSYFLDDTLKIYWNKIHKYLVNLGLVSLPRHHWSLCSDVPVSWLAHASPSIYPVSWLLS